MNFYRFAIAAIIAAMPVVFCHAAMTNGKNANKTAAPKSSGIEFQWKQGEQLFRDRTFEGHYGRMNWVNSVALSPDGKYALSGSGDHTLKLWNIATGKCIRTFEEHSDQVNSVAFSPDGKYALSGSSTLKLWDITTGKCIRTFEEHDGRMNWVHSVAFSPDGKYALSGSSDHTLKLWNIATGKCIRTFKEHYASVNSVAFSPDGKYALSGSSDHTLKLWDITTGKCIRTFKEHSDWVSSVAFSPDGKYALSGNRDETLKLWDIATAKCLQTFEGHSDWVHSVAFAADGKYALSGNRDETLKLWDIATGKCLQTFEGHSGAVYSVAFSPDGRYIISGSANGQIKIWNPHPPRTLAQAIQTEIATMAPKLPDKMEHGKYENKATFDARVAKAKTDYEAAAAAYNARIKAGPNSTELSNAFTKYYGGPNIVSTTYNADSGIFTFKTTPSDNPENKEQHEYFFAIKDAIPNKQAEAFEAKLKAAVPQIYFRFLNGTISISRASVVIDNKTYAAVPSAESEESERQVVDLSGLASAQPMKPGEIEIAMAEKSDDPEIAAKAREVARLKQEKAKTEQTARLEAQLAQLRNEGIKTYSSDVDKPSFTAPEKPNDYALVIGIESYSGDLPEADFAERDAEAMKAHLLALGVPQRNIKFLKGSDATNAKLRNYLESWLPKNVKEDSKVYFYFSGHGAPDMKTGGAYILPWDGDPEFLETSAYPLEQVYASLGKLKAAKVVAVLDSCFSGAGGHSVLPKGARPLVVVKKTGAIPENLTLITAAKESEITSGLDEQGHGIFTYYLLKGLDEGIRDTGKLCGYIKPKVQDEASRHNRSQTPVCSGPATQLR